MRRLALALAALAAAPALMTATTAATADESPIRALVITGDHAYHDWKATTDALKDFLPKRSDGRIKVDVTATPAKDLTDENLAKYDVLILNYVEGKPTDETKWSDANKKAFLDAVRGGKGLVVYHYASAGFAKPNWEEFEKAIAGGWRTQGFHGPAHEFDVKKTDADHPISRGAPAKFHHVKDELYQNSLLPPGSTVLATAYSDPDKPRGTGKDEAVIWVNTYGKGRVYNNVLGHDTAALNDPSVQEWMTRGVVWASGKE